MLGGSGLVLVSDVPPHASHPSHRIRAVFPEKRIEHRSAVSQALALVNATRGDSRRLAGRRRRGSIGEGDPGPPTEFVLDGGEVSGAVDEEVRRLREVLAEKPVRECVSFPASDGVEDGLLVGRDRGAKIWAELMIARVAARSSRRTLRIASRLQGLDLAGDRQDGEHVGQAGFDGLTGAMEHRPGA